MQQAIANALLGYSKTEPRRRRWWRKRRLGSYGLVSALGSGLLRPDQLPFLGLQLSNKILALITFHWSLFSKVWAPAVPSAMCVQTIWS